MAQPKVPEGKEVVSSLKAAASDRLNRAVKLVKEAESNLRSARVNERKARAQLAELEDDTSDLGL